MCRPRYHIGDAARILPDCSWECGYITCVTRRQIGGASCGLRHCDKTPSWTSISHWPATADYIVITCDYMILQ